MCLQAIQFHVHFSPRLLHSALLPVLSVVLKFPAHPHQPWKKKKWRKLRKLSHSRSDEREIEKKKKFNKREKTFQRNGYVIADDPKEARERLSVWYKEMIRTLKNKKEKWRGKWKKISNLDWVREARLLLAPGLTLRRLWRTGRRCRSRPDE